MEIRVIERDILRVRLFHQNQTVNLMVYLLSLLRPQHSSKCMRCGNRYLTQESKCPKCFKEMQKEVETHSNTAKHWESVFKHVSEFVREIEEKPGSKLGPECTNSN